MSTNLKNMVVEGCYNVAVGDGVLHQGLSYRVHRTSLIRDEHLERRRKVFGKYRKKVEK